MVLLARAFFYLLWVNNNSAIRQCFLRGFEVLPAASIIDYHQVAFLRKCMIKFRFQSLGAIDFLIWEDLRQI